MARLILDVEVRGEEKVTQAEKKVTKSAERMQKAFEKLRTTSSFTEMVKNTKLVQKVLHKTTSEATKLVDQMEKIDTTGFVKTAAKARQLLKLEEQINEEFEKQVKLRRMLDKRSGGEAGRRLQKQLDIMQAQTRELRKQLPLYQRMKQRVSGLSQKLGTVGKIVAGGLGLFGIISLVSLVQNAISGLVRTVQRLGEEVGRSFYRINVEMEQMRILMDTATGSVQGGARAFQDILTFATKAPFSVESLANSFVKLRTAGLEPMDGTMQTLVDSVAAFGGSSEQLRLVSIAIQQMVGKGVISMEELRRQFGEQVPTAMRAMAEGLQMSILDMFDLIAEGGLEAGRGIEAMLRVLREWHGGAAEKRMDSMQGAVVRMKTEWSKFMITVSKSNNLWKNAVTLVKQVADAILDFSQSEYGQRVIDRMTSSMNELLDKFRPEYVAGFLTALSNGFRIAAEIARTMVTLILEAMRVAYDLYKKFSGTNMQQRIVASREIDTSEFPEPALETTTIELQAQMDMDPIEASFKRLGDLIEDTKMKFEKATLDAQNFNLFGFVDSLEGALGEVDLGGDKLIAQAKNMTEQMEQTIISSYAKLKKEAKELGEELAERQFEGFKRLFEIDEEIAELQPPKQLTAKEEWQEQLRIIQDYKDKAREAWKTGDLEKYKFFLEKVGGLIRDIEVESIREEVDEGQFKRTEKSLQNQIKYYKQLSDQQRTMQGRYTYDQKVKEAEKALRDLRKTQAEGGREVETAEEVRVQKLKEMIALRNAYQSLDQKEEGKVAAELKRKEEQMKYLKDTEEVIKNTRKAIDEAKAAEGEASLQMIENLKEQIRLLEIRQRFIASGQSLSADPYPGVSGRAFGGPVKKDELYIVGEKGPEMFVPDTSGTIIPNDQMFPTKREIASAMPEMELLKIEFDISAESFKKVVDTTKRLTEAALNAVKESMVVDNFALPAPEVEKFVLPEPEVDLGAYQKILDGAKIYLWFW